MAHLHPLDTGFGGGVRELDDDGSWLMEWFDEDVMPALERGDAYTTSVPFKSAHASKDSDGVLQPAPVHFTGPFAVISGPDGGSHRWLVVPARRPKNPLHRVLDQRVLKRILYIESFTNP